MRGANRSHIARLVAVVLTAAVIAVSFAAAPTASAQVYTLATIVNADAVNVRSGPGESFPVTRGVARGQQVGLVGRNADGSWVQLDGGGWVHRNFVQPYSNYDIMNLPGTGGDSAPQPQPSASYVLAYVVNTDRLNVRSGPSPDYRATRGLVYGQQVGLVGRNSDGSWVQLQTSGGRQEWVNARYVRAYGGFDLTNLPVTSDTTPASPPPSSTLITATVVNASRLNVRSGPGESYPVVRKVVYGEQVNLIGRSIDGSWVELQSGGGPQWVYARFVQPANNANIISLPATGNVRPAPGGSTGASVHVVQAGETLASIAARYGTNWRALAAANGISNPNYIYAGQRLTIP